MIDYRIIRKENYTGKIGELVSMLEHTKAVTPNSNNKHFFVFILNIQFSIYVC
ncbi:hypothetical protein [Peribacillus cavernae]|uniref:hypothetical protein n=1 Tax=Peribacillus cavernae TaxID=1674310 RepID=UPI00163D26B7|nr:hypothetical protein [Peribacillus cavernae]MDQ0217908.1 hypothetical protein [Peribacillus cavernae]